MNFHARSELMRILHPQFECKYYNSQCILPISVEHIVAAGLYVLQSDIIKDIRPCVACYAAVDDLLTQLKPLQS